MTLCNWTNWYQRSCIEINAVLKCEAVLYLSIGNWIGSHFLLWNTLLHRCINVIQLNMMYVDSKRNVHAMESLFDTKRQEVIYNKLEIQKTYFRTCLATSFLFLTKICTIFLHLNLRTYLSQTYENNLTTLSPETCDRLVELITTTVHHAFLAMFDTQITC